MTSAITSAMTSTKTSEESKKMVEVNKQKSEEDRLKLEKLNSDFIDMMERESMKIHQGVEEAKQSE
jgi:hypothetical protein